jgi:thiamine-monophosphate kinase
MGEKMGPNKKKGGRPVLSENALLEIIRGTIQAREPFLKTGMGDDCAVLCLPGREKSLLMTTDILNEEIHFRREWTTPFLLGYKALTVNQSDIAAMGGRPLVLLVNLSLPTDISADFIEEFYRGLDLAARRFGGALAGGDLSGSPRGFCLSIAILGESWGRQPVLRSGAQPGDLLCVAGWLGLSAIGLRFLSDGGSCAKSLEKRVRAGRFSRPRTAIQWRERCLLAHLAPEPMTSLSAWLGRYYVPTAMMDVSDGISMDLSRLCAASGVGCRVEFEKLPGCPVGLVSAEEQKHALLHGGEDYALLFTLPRTRSVHMLSALQSKCSVPVVAIGEMTKNPGRIALMQNGRERELPVRGYDHFAK